MRLFILSLVEECRPRERRLTGSVFIFHHFSGRQRLIHVSVILSARGPSSRGQKMQAVEHLFLSCVDVFITLLSDLCLPLCLSFCCASGVGLALSVFLLSSVIQPPSISHSAVSPLYLSSPIMTFISLLSLLPPLIWVTELVHFMEQRMMGVFWKIM